MSFPQSFAADVEGPACADALAAQRNRASPGLSRPVGTCREQDGQPEPPPCDPRSLRLSKGRTTPFVYFNAPHS